MHRRNFIKTIMLAILGSFFPKLLLPVQEKELGWGCIIDSSMDDVETWIHVAGTWTKDRIARLLVDGQYVGTWKPKHELLSPEGTLAYWMLPHDPDNFDPLHHCPQDIEYLMGLDLPSDKIVLASEMTQEASFLSG